MRIPLSGAVLFIFASLLGFGSAPTFAIRPDFASDAEETLLDFHSGGKDMFAFLHASGQTPGWLDGPIRIDTEEYSVSGSKRYLALWAYLPRTVRMMGNKEEIESDIKHGFDPDQSRYEETKAFVVVDSADPAGVKGTVRWAMYVDRYNGSADLAMLDGPDSAFVVVNWSYVNNLKLGLFRVGSEPGAFFRQLGPFPFKLSTSPPKEAEIPPEPISTLVLRGGCMSGYHPVRLIAEPSRNRILLVANREGLDVCDPTYLRFDLTTGEWTKLPAAGQLLEPQPQSAEGESNAKKEKLPSGNDMFAFRPNDNPPGWLDGPKRIDTLEYSVSRSSRRYLTLWAYLPRIIRMMGNKKAIEDTTKRGFDPDQSRCDEATAFVVVDSADPAGVKGAVRWAMYVDKKNVSANLAGLRGPDSVFVVVDWSYARTLYLGLIRIGSEPGAFFKQLGPFPFKLSTRPPKEAEIPPEPISTLVLGRDAECGGGYQPVRVVAEPSQMRVLASERPQRILIVGNRDEKVCDPAYLRFDLVTRKWTKLPVEGQLLVLEPAPSPQRKSNPGKDETLDLTTPLGNAEAVSASHKERTRE